MDLLGAGPDARRALRGGISAAVLALPLPLFASPAAPTTNPPPAAPGSADVAPDDNARQKAALIGECGAGFEIHETAHWIIAHKADPAWVDASARMLERTHDAFFDQFRKAGFEPRPLTRKLVCVLIGTQEDFAAYMAAVRGASDRPAQGAARGRRAPAGLGSYSGKSNRIQLCDIRSIRRGPRAVGDAEMARQNVARIAHEGAHQLSFNTGILRAQGCPMWVAEGLACNFEFTDADKPFGPLTDNLSPRAAHLGRLMAEGRVDPLRRIVTMPPQVAHEADNMGPTYVQGWGLFRFLITGRPRQLKAYLADLASRERGPANGAQAMAMFESAFGPVGDLERDWRSFLDRFHLRSDRPPAAEGAEGVQNP